jgi:hypothetical protein
VYRIIENFRPLHTCTLLSMTAALTAVSPLAFARINVTLEGDATWQSRNDVRIPGDTGTDFSLSDFNKGPFPSYRLYLSKIWGNKHELRALYAPLEAEVSGEFAQPVVFQGASFAAGVSTTGRYKFNSYRLTYAYHFPASSSPWRWALGFTGKIRDASIGLTQGAISAENSNVGFVPLLNLQAVYNWAPEWSLRFDMDGLAAKQGRAIDAALFLERSFGGPTSGGGTSVFIGYRTIEGGADNKRVYNFAWIQKAVLGLNVEF